MVRVTVDSLPSIQRGLRLSKGGYRSDRSSCPDALRTWKGEDVADPTSARADSEAGASTLSMDVASVQRNYESLSRAMQAKQAQLVQVLHPLPHRQALHLREHPGTLIMQKSTTPAAQGSHAVPDGSSLQRRAPGAERSGKGRAGRREQRKWLPGNGGLHPLLPPPPGCLSCGAP